MLSERTGVASRLLGAFGIDDVAFLGEPSLALGTVIVVTVWFHMGYYMVIFLGRPAGHPRRVLRGGRIDGANAWQRFRPHHPAPAAPHELLRHRHATVASSPEGFDLVFVLTGGGPAGSTTLLIFYVYEQAFLFGELGYAAAIGSVLVVVMLAWSALMFAVSPRAGRFDNDETLPGAGPQAAGPETVCRRRPRDNDDDVARTAGGPARG